MKPEEFGTKHVSKDNLASNYSRLKDGGDFTYYCIAYNKLKNYKAFFSCVDDFEKRFANKDYEIPDPMGTAGVPVHGGTNYVIEDNLADAYFDLENYQAAKKHALKAVTLRQKKIDGSHMFNAYSTLDLYIEMPRSWRIAALASLKLGDKKTVMEIIPKLHGHKRYAFAGGGFNYRVENAAHNALIRIYLALDRPSDAKKSFDAIVDGSASDAFGSAYMRLFMPFNEHSLIEMMTNKEVLIEQNLVYSGLLSSTGDLAESLKHLESVLSDPKISTFPSYHWVALFKRAKIHYDAKELPQSISNLKTAIGIIEKQRSSITADAQKMGFAGDKQAVYSSLVTALMDSGRYDEAFAYAERGKARALVDMLASKKKFSGGNVMSSSKQKQLLAQLDTSEAKARVFASESDRSTTRSVAINNRIALMQQAPELSSLVTVAAPDVKEIQALLPEGETLIEYYGSGDKLFAFVVSKSGIRGVKLNAAGLKESVTAFRDAILDPKSDAYKREGQKLYKQIIAPVVSGIKTNNITIVPHGALHYVPFSALVNRNGFLIDQYNLRILPSASVMKFLKKNRNKAGSLLAFGNPDLGEAKYDLPFAQKEAEMIARKIKGAKLLVRGQATETAVKSYGNSFKYLHFASHGTFDAENPLNSGLLLAKDAQNDGMLTVGELYDLNLNADLVTLSACETALGKIANGDDVVGFTRGFLYAGASSIVSSLWQVDDAATSVLMQSFYDNLSKTDKRSALRKAQLKAKKKYPHPYYWAAFQITGAVK